MNGNSTLRTWPAVEVTRAPDPDIAIAVVDDFAPTAIEACGDVLRVFFASRRARDEAHVALRQADYIVEALDVADEDWARRSQADLRPVVVGRITVVPTSEVDSRQSVVDSRRSIVITIEPSMGFGTGHHATTRLCLRALQAFDLSSRVVLDVGTGSGVLALAAARLGASRALGIDYDPDAIQSAVENLARNEGVDGVTFEVADLMASSLAAADLVTANLTGALLQRAAKRLVDLVRRDGILILSGLLAEERADVVGAFSGADVVWEQSEEGWVAVAMTKHA